MSIEHRLKPAERRLQALAERKLSHRYIKGTAEFDSALLNFFLRIKQKACSGCFQNEEAEDDEAVPCIQSCPIFDEVESDLAEDLLTDDNILNRLLYEKIMGPKHGQA